LSGSLEAGATARWPRGLLSVLIDDLGVTMSPFGIVTRRKHRLSPGAQALLDAIRAAARTLYSPLPALADASGASSAPDA
jgi:DNA-binding transcriptional LysR family regulator